MIKNNGLMYGLAAGILASAYTVFLYFFQPMSIFRGFTSLLPGFIYLAFMLTSTRKEKIKLGENFQFRAGLRVGFLVAVLGLLLNNIVLFILLKTDPGLVEIQKEGVLANLENWLGGMYSPNQKDLLIEGLNKTDYTPTFGKTAYSYARWLIPSFIVSAAFSWIIKGPSRRY